ncbi:efflux RND transporter periplasmic adaptor subunit [Mucilaginibacter sp. HMF7410]|uniref:Efflux RND transporter periplasmic adaptor subunit n=2 Tax=Mucilaginibacter arboris TaxID=2682090 RepID=A0A7K1SXM6_9SPHI|nr:efflux RND transporter periplasmic adaptor subunit [Mucilaginibacter arboris]
MNRAISNIIIISCFALFSCKKKQAPSDPSVPVNLMKAKAENVLYYDKYPSTTAALSQVNLLPQVPGAITGIFFKEGSHVKKGQKLYEIDKRLYQQNYAAAVANLQVQQGNQVQAKQDEDRYAYLNKYNAVAKQLYDHAVIAYQNAKNTVKSAEEAVRTARTNLGYAVIYAPFSGTIGFSQVKLGNVVTAGSTVLNTISTDNPMAVDFLINEKQIARFDALKNSRHLMDSLFTLLLPNNSLYPHTGKISVIDRAVDPQTGAVRIRLVFDNPTNALIAGMSCIVRVHNEETKPQILIPNKAVTEQMGEYFVFTAKDSLVTDSAGQKNKSGKMPKRRKLMALQRKVQVGQTIGPDIIVKKGINEGDKIVVDGVQSLHDGSPITTANKVAPSQGGKGGKQ